MSLLINLIRPEEADESARGLFRRCIQDERVKAWVGTTAAKWLRRDKESAVPVPPGTAGLPPWAVRIVDEGGMVHRFALGPRAKDQLSHIADYLEAAVKAASRPDHAERDRAEAALESLVRTSVEQAHAHAGAWFSLTAREAETAADRRLLKSVAGRSEIAVDGDDLAWKLCFPRDLRNVASQLGNCLGNSRYANDVRTGNAEIWVLSDSKGRVVAAAHLDPREKRFIEVKAAGNTPPAGYEEHIRVLAAARDVKADVWDLKALYLAQMDKLPRLKESGPWAAVHVIDEYAVFRTDQDTGGKQPKRIVVARETKADGETCMQAQFFLRDASGFPFIKDLETVCLTISNAVAASGTLWAEPGTDCLPMAGPADKGCLASWRYQIAGSRRVAGWTLHELDASWNGNPGPVLVAEGFGMIMHLGSPGRLSLTAAIPPPPEFWDLVKSMDPLAETVRVTPIPRKIFSPGEIRTSLGHLPLIPTDCGWTDPAEAFRKTADGLWLARLREGLGDCYATLVVEQLPEDKLKVVATMTPDRKLELMVPSICLDLNRLDSLMNLVEHASGFRPAALCSGEPVDNDPAIWMPDGTAPDRTGERVWSSGTVHAYRTPGRSGRIVAVTEERQVLWQISTPRSALVTRGSVHSREAVESLARYLVEGGLTLEDPTDVRRKSRGVMGGASQNAAWEDKLALFGYRLINGRPLSRANTELDRVDCGNGIEWVRADLRLKNGEDRAWKARIPTIRDGKPHYTTFGARIELAVTGRKEGALDVGAIIGIEQMVKSPALIGGLIRILDASRMTLDAPFLAALGLRRSPAGHEKADPDTDLHVEGLRLKAAHQIIPRWLVLAAGEQLLASVSISKNEYTYANNDSPYRMSLEIFDPAAATPETMAGIAILFRRLCGAAAPGA